MLVWSWNIIWWIDECIIVFDIENCMETATLENLSKEELIHYQELFSVLDKDDSGTIPTAQFPLYIRGLGHCPTENELR